MQKKSYGTLSKGAIVFGQPCIIKNIKFLEHNIKHISNNTNYTAFLKILFKLSVFTKNRRSYTV